MQKRGNDINFQNEYGYTALMLASDCGYLDVVSLLIETGVDVNLKDVDGRTALHWSLSFDNHHLEIVSLLLEEGADVNHKDEYGETELMIASNYGYLEIVSKLLEEGTDVNIKDNDGRTALHWSLDYDHMEIISMLLKAGVDINEKDGYGQTPLMIASRKSFVKVISLLLAAGADVNIEYRDDGSVLEMMKKECHDESALTIIQDLDNLDETELDKMFDVDPYLWTRISKHHSQKAFLYFVQRYADLLNVSRDIIHIIFQN